MKAKELRIGNLVLYKGELFEIDFDSFNIIKELEPIELTEEILLKCGFEKYAPSIFNEDRYVLGFISLIATTSKDILFNGIHIKHLHQLQNLYFALTGEELKINLL